MASRTSNNIKMLIHCSQFILLLLLYLLFLPLLLLPHLLLQKHMCQHGAHGLAGHGHGLRLLQAQAQPGQRNGTRNITLIRSGLTSTHGENDRVNKKLTKNLTRISLHSHAVQEPAFLCGFNVSAVPIHSSHSDMWPIWFFPLFPPFPVSRLMLGVNSNSAQKQINQWIKPFIRCMILAGCLPFLNSMCPIHD